MLINIKDKLRIGGGTNFTRQELNLLLPLYGYFVQLGKWRDYAIDSGKDSAVFSIFRSSHETPLYCVTKMSSRSIVKPSVFTLHCKGKLVKQTNDLKEIVEYLRENE